MGCQSKLESAHGMPFYYPHTYQRPPPTSLPPISSHLHNRSGVLDTMSMFLSICRRSSEGLVLRRTCCSQQFSLVVVTVDANTGMTKPERYVWNVYCLLSCTACYPQALAALTLLATITLLSIERFLFQLVLELGEVGSARAGWMCE